MPKRAPEAFRPPARYPGVVGIIRPKGLRLFPGPET